jgi:PAS domain S-box-containing protein
MDESVWPIAAWEKFQAVQHGHHSDRMTAAPAVAGPAPLSAASDAGGPALPVSAPLPDAEAQLSAAATMLAVLDPEGRVRSVNPAFLAFADRPAGDLVGSLLWDAPWGRGSRAARDRLARAVARAKGGRPVDHRETLRAANGSLCVVAVHLAPIDGGPYLLFEARVLPAEPDGVDATERLFMMAPEPMAVLDARGRFRRVNPALLSLLGYDPEEIAGLALPDIVPVDDAVEAATTMESLARGRTATDFLTRCRTADGALRWMSWSLSAGDERVYAVAHDMTARIEAETALVERELQLGLLAETLPGAIYRLRKDPDGTETILYISDGVADLTGHPAEAVMADPGLLRRSISAEDIHWVRMAIEGIGAQGGTADLVYRLVRADGAVVWVRDIGRARRLDDGATVWDGIGLDITAWKQAEMQLHAAKEEAEQANRAKSDFLANMSHELRTPLNAILGFSDLMRAEAFGPIGNARYKDYADDIHDSGSHLLALIGDILDMAKVEAGKYQLQESECDVADIVGAVVRLFKPVAGRSGPDVLADLPEDLPRLVADERLMRQILNNLVSNAVKFTEEGAVTIGAGIGAGGGLEIAVADTGIGMTEMEIERALTPFGQIENSMSRRKQGTGLGLTLVQKFVDLHGGRLRIDSTPGEGTRITVGLPAWRVLRPVRKRA